MPMAERSWNDSRENYVDGYVLDFTATTVTAINSSGQSPYLSRPIVLFGITVTLSQAGASGDIALVDGTASADTGDTRKWRGVISSAITTDRNNAFHVGFPRGLFFDKGIMVSATTVTGAISLQYMNRF